MTGYRRFIAYVYEYRNGRKAENCGFIKLEVREGRCTMEIHLSEDKQMESCSVYGFIRKEGLMQGILLGSFQSSSDPAVNVLEADAGNMGSSGISLDQLSGMILETDTGSFMGTQWDDLPIRPDHFQKLEEKEQEAEQLEENTQQQKAETIPEQDNAQQQKAEPKSEPKGGELQAESIEEETEENPTLFPDCDQCWRLRPGDLRQICRKSNVYCNNRFLQHGYSHFGYILLCRRTDGQYILGVPGIYDQQERFMAEMFGFPWFKEWPLPGIKKGKSGYWYRICVPCEMSLDGRL